MADPTPASPEPTPDPAVATPLVDPSAAPAPDPDPANAGGDGKDKGKAVDPAVMAPDKDKDAAGKPPPDQAAWRAGIENDDHKKFADRFASAADLAKAGFEFRQKLSNAVIVPGKDASDEDVAEFRKKMNVPDKSEGYDLKLPEDYPEQWKESEAAVLQQAAALAHNMNATAPQAQEMVDSYFTLVAQSMNAGVEAQKKKMEDSLAALKRRWPTDAEFDRNTELADVAFNGFFPKDAKDLELKDGTKLANHPIMVEAMANVGRSMGEDSMRVEFLSDGDKKGIDDRIDELHALPPDKYRSAAVQRELVALYEKKVGIGPIVGEQERTI